MENHRLVYGLRDAGDPLLVWDGLLPRNSLKVANDANSLTLSHQLFRFAVFRTLFMTREFTSRQRSSWEKIEPPLHQYRE